MPSGTKFKKEKKVKVRGKEGWRGATIQRAFLDGREGPFQTLFFIITLKSMGKEH